MSTYKYVRPIMTLSGLFISYPPRVQYDLMSAVRGPDEVALIRNTIEKEALYPKSGNALASIKMAFTGRIRRIVWDVADNLDYRFPGDYNKSVVSQSDITVMEGQVAKILPVLGITITEDGSVAGTSSPSVALRHFISHIRSVLNHDEVLAHPVWGGRGRDMRKALKSLDYAYNNAYNI